LALDALAILRRFRGTVAADAAWSDPDFARQVDTVRTELAPIRSRHVLADSFAREAAHLHGSLLAPIGRPLEAPGPVRLAYAVRWLELGDGEDRPGWSRLVGGHRRALRATAGPRRRPPAIARQSR
jgi:hypothetical protein